MVSYLQICLISLCGGLVQSTLGFGFGMVSVMFFPLIMGSIPQSSAVTAAVSMVASAVALLPYRKSVRLSYIIPTLLANAVIMPVMTHIAKLLPTRPLSLALGVVMILFSVYYIKWNQRIKLRPTTATAVASGAIGGTLGGLFALGGVPVGVYLLNASETKDVYYATMQAYIIISDVYGTAVRVMDGIIVRQTVWWIIAGLCGMLAGVAIGKRVYRKLDQERLKKWVYVLIGVSGLLKVVGYFL
ncbi:MAG: sulfite exporter TauE/SafE family protein [Oscillospiraceae bacterium]